MGGGPATSPRTAGASRKQTVTDQSELGELPRFSREIALIFRRVRPRHSDAPADGHFVLRPFSGILDVRPRLGHVPMIDLSYLTLEPLIAPTLERPISGESDSPPADLRDVDRSGIPENRSSEGVGNDSDDEPGHRTVREALFGETEANTEWSPTDGQSLGTDIGRQTGPRSDLLSWSRGEPTSLQIMRSHDSQLRETSKGAPRSVGNRDPGSPIPEPRPEDSDPDLAGQTTKVESDSETYRGPFGSPLTDTPPGEPHSPSSDSASLMDSTDHSSVIQSRSSISSDQPNDGLSVSSTDMTGETDAISPPRMTARREDTRDTSQSKSTTATTSRPHRVIQDRSGSNAGWIQSPHRGRTRGSDPSIHNPDDSRRSMEFDRSDQNVNQTANPHHRPPDRSTADTSHEYTGTRDPGPAQAEIPGHRSIIEASSDPESRLVDRLYRALREREAIERRRRGGR